MLGLSVLGEFKDHAGYDGIFLGFPGSEWHLEFTRSKEPAQHFPDEDDLLVFYPETRSAHGQLLSRLEKNNIETQVPKNPYWRENGILVKDPDGFGVIISEQKIP